MLHYFFQAGSRGEKDLASGIWTAVSGAAAQAHNVDVIANNLANANTDGFKKDQPTFKEYLAVNEREKYPLDVPRGPIKDKEFYPIDGTDQSFVVMDGTFADLKPGNLKVTNSPLDMALDGPGFFEVSTPYGIRYTKHGSFKMATDGRLVTSEGYPVLASVPGGLAAALPADVQPIQGGIQAQGGAAVGPQNEAAPETLARMINLQNRQGPFSVSATGEVFMGEDRIAQLSVVEFNDPRRLKKQGNQLFQNYDATNYKVGGESQTKVHQGMLETSNVNPVHEMTNLIRANRMFEHDLKAIKTYSEMMGREVNDLGKL